MKSYLDELMKKSLIQIGMSEKDNKIRITKAGVDFNLRYSQMKDLEKTFGL